MYTHIRAKGQFDVTKMGNVSNVGLMAQKAEEYGSHDKTFEIPSDGVVRVVDDAGKVRDIMHVCVHVCAWYGSHDKAFEISSDGVVRVVDDAGKVRCISVYVCMYVCMYVCLYVCDAIV